MKHQKSVEINSILPSQYKLTKSNKIYYGVIAISSISLYIYIGLFTPYMIGRLIGLLLSYLLIPMLIALIVWKLSKNKVNAGSVTFNITLTLAVLGQISQFANKANINIKLSEMSSQRSVYYNSLANGQDLDEINESYDNYVNSMMNGFGELSRSSTGDEKELYKIMAEFVEEKISIVKIWQNSFDKINSPAILNLSLLKNDSEIIKQKKLITFYLESTKRYQLFFTNMVPNITLKLNKIGVNSPVAIGGISGITEQFEKNEPVFTPLMVAHINYGNNMIEYLELLQLNQNKWKLENDELIINDEIIGNKVNEIMEQIELHGRSINNLAEKLVQVMIE
jgi:hypothetical protein